MKIRSAKFAAALLPLLALPSLQAQAADDAQMDACIKAFIASNIEKDRPVSVVKLPYLGVATNGAPTEYTINLSARLKDSGKRIAKGTCAVKGDEVVLTVNGKPAQATKLAQAESVQATR